MASQNTHARFRLLRLGWAVGTSLLSKAGSVVLQLVAIPVAIRVMGFEKYGVFAALTAAWACMSLSGIGVGPGLTKAIARTHAAGDEASEAAYFRTALSLLLCAGLLAGLVVFAVLRYLPATSLFGSGFAAYQAVIITCAPLLGALICAETILGVVERTQAGYQEMHRANIWGAVGNLGGGVVLLLGIHHLPTVPFLVITVLGVPTLSRMCNAIQLVVWHRPYLLKHSARFSRHKAKELLGDGLSFTASQSIAPLLMREGAKLLASHVGGPAAAGILTVLNSLSTFLGSFVVMISAPLWPALMDAAARHDYAWFNAARHRLLLGVMLYATAAGLMLSLFGTWIIDRWLAGQVHISQAILIAYSCGYVLMIWAHLNYICLTGLGILTAPAVIYVGEATVAMGIAWFGMNSFGISGLIWGQAATMLAISAWLFPLILSQRMRAWKADGIAPLAAAAPST